MKVENGSGNTGGRALIVTHFLPYTCVRSEQLNGEQDVTNGSVEGNNAVNHEEANGHKLMDAEFKFGVRRDFGALFAGIQSLDNAVIIGSIESDDKAVHQALQKKYNVRPIHIDVQQSNGHYEGFCKTNLWPLFHYIMWQPSDGTKEKQWWADYIKVNQQFAKEIAQEYQPGDHIWIHDYHFLLLPQMLRELIPDAVIGFFLHTPFPSSEIFRCLPQRKDVLKGMLGSNLIGFQTYSYARHFISACTRILGCESNSKGVEDDGRFVSIQVFPIGIDVDEAEKNRHKPSVLAKIASIREMYAGKKIIIGRDKLDQIKGVQHKLNAFEKFLDQYPEWQDQVVLIQVTSPTESSSPKLETQISELVSRINGSYGSLGFVPVHHYHQVIERDEYYALLSIADVALITSVRDGMNTSSHEYIVCQQENHGPLILSEFTGTAGSLQDAILVNPWDYVGVAKSINNALSMSAKDKEDKHRQLYEYVKRNNAQNWAKSFVDQMVLTALQPEQQNPTPVLDIQQCVDMYTKSKKRIFFLDYDGTLTPIRKTPNAAIPSDLTVESLAKLTSDDNTIVYVVSGRDQVALDGWLGSVKNLGMSAEHGCFIKYVGSDKWINLSEEIDLSWKDDVLPIFEYYTERTPGSFIEEKRSSLTWHYRLADPSYGSWQAKECHNHLENAIISKLPVEVLVGKKNLEIRPQAINKGEIVNKLMQLHAGADFVFCAGDDKTDEDMFRQLRKCQTPAAALDNKELTVGAQVQDGPACNIITCTIGTAAKMTLADWHVESSEQLVDILSKFGSSQK
ncbi:hypothetical protein MIR68_012514 [Amoeboaphelidium protococcarum]|nr:hypothetical protein MIR68_012514 [Amoeboaphelidium protococcarum]